MYLTPAEERMLTLVDEILGERYRVPQRKGVLEEKRRQLMALRKADPRSWVSACDKLGEASGRRR